MGPPTPSCREHGARDSPYRLQLPNAARPAPPPQPPRLAPPSTLRPNSSAEQAAHTPEGDLEQPWRMLGAAVLPASRYEPPRRGNALLQVEYRRRTWCRPWPSDSPESPSTNAYSPSISARGRKHEATGGRRPSQPGEAAG